MYKTEIVIIGFAKEKRRSLFTKLLTIFQKEKEYDSLYIRLVEERTNDWLTFNTSYSYFEESHFENFQLNNDIVEEYHFNVEGYQVTAMLKLFNKYNNKRLSTLSTLRIILSNRFKTLNESNKDFIFSSFTPKFFKVLELNKFVYMPTQLKLPDFKMILDNFIDSNKMRPFRYTRSEDGKVE